MSEKPLERIILEEQLKKALKQNQFYLNYQPKVDLLTHDIIGMEALVRWNHPDLGLIPPINFITLAEETGLISPLGEWVLREACTMNKSWQDKGYPPFVVSVNISVKQLMDQSTVNQIKSILLDTGLNPKWLEFEVTESIFVDITQNAGLLHEIRALGIQISIDDFGTEYSSFNYIKHLPIDTLKIDRSFIRDIHSNSDSRAIVKAIITVAHTLGINVLAEGIELEEQLLLLSADGCNQGQGYLFAKPISSQEFEKYLDNHFKKKK